MSPEEFYSEPRQAGYYLVRMDDSPIWQLMALTQHISRDGLLMGWSTDFFFYPHDNCGVVEVNPQLLGYTLEEASAARFGPDEDDVGDSDPQSLLGRLNALRDVFMENLDESLQNASTRREQQLRGYQRQMVINAVDGLLDEVYEMIGGLPATQGPDPPPGHVRLDLPL